MLRSLTWGDRRNFCAMVQRLPQRVEGQARHFPASAQVGIMSSIGRMARCMLWLRRPGVDVFMTAATLGDPSRDRGGSSQSCRMSIRMATHMPGDVGKLDWKQTVASACPHKIDSLVDMTMQRG